MLLYGGEVDWWASDDRVATYIDIRLIILQDIKARQDNTAPMHTMMGGLIIRFDILICILYIMRDIYTGFPLKSELLQNYQK